MTGYFLLMLAIVVGCLATLIADDFGGAANLVRQVFERSRRFLAVILVALLAALAPAPAEASVGAIDIPALVGEILSSVVKDVGGSPDAEGSRPAPPAAQTKSRPAEIPEGNTETHPNPRPQDPPPPLNRSGKASWYGERFAGRKTASGERFNPQAMTTAHRSLPFGTDLEVCRKGRCVEVRVTDRGPFIRGRALDLSRAAFARLAPTSRGVIHVRWRVM